MPFDPLTVVFAIVAILVVWKLNSVLGQNTGFQRGRPPTPPEGRFADRRRGPSSASKRLIRLPGAPPPPAVADPARWQRFIAPGSAPTDGLEAIAAADAEFAPEPFLSGARGAYEAIVLAFATGDRRTLQNLLDRDVYDGFVAAIAGREERGETLSTSFVSIDDAKFCFAALAGRTARVAVRFVSKQISATHDSGGALRDGSPDAIHDVIDVWTFERDTRSRDPNWRLAATEAGQ